MAMEEVVKTHLPLLAWRWHEADQRYELVYDDQVVGDIRVDARGRGEARYHQTRWYFEQDRKGGFYRLLSMPSAKELGRLVHESGAELTASQAIAQVPEEGTIRLNGRRYRFLRDSWKIPPKVTITGEQGQPLLQFREEEEGAGRIQIDNQVAARSKDFEVLVLWGLHLYLTGSDDVHTAPALLPPSATQGKQATPRHSLAPFLWGLAALAMVGVFYLRRKARFSASLPTLPTSEIDHPASV